MPKKAPEKSPETPVFQRKGARPRPFLALVSLIFFVLTTLSLVDYSPEQTDRFGQATSDNLVGELGRFVGYWTIFAVGLGAWLLPVTLAWLSFLFFRSYGFLLKLGKLAFWCALTASVAVICRVMEIYLRPEVPAEKLVSNYFPHGMGGWVGRAVYDDRLQTWLSMVGTLVVFGILALFGIWFLLRDNLLKDASRALREARESWSTHALERRERRAAEKRVREANRKAFEARKREEAAKKTETRTPSPATGTPPATAEGPPASTATPFPPRKGFSPFGRRKDDGKSKPARETKAAAKAGAVFEPLVEAGDDEAAPADPLPRATPPSATKADGTLRIIESEQTRKATTRRPEKKGDYLFPPLSLLSEPPPVPYEDASAAHQETADALVQTLEEFGIKVTPGDIHAGPVITRYDVYPAPGVRVERIANLDKNIALGLKALSVRILAPVPGKGCVGIEVPNKNPQAVFIRDILESEDWVNTKAEIPIALGKEVSGKPMIADLTKMPHLLIAGSTGSGKTVCINSVITSLLYHSSPEDLRFVMVDPKIVEMKVFNALPHMLVPVVTDPKKVPNALRYLLNEMERRYQSFAEVGVRNIAGYNAKMAKGRKERAEAEERAAELDANLTPEERAAAANAVSVPRDPNLEGTLPAKLPYVVCIVDELADLMMVAPADIETGIARLAQLARAAGIHLILATQRPSVNVITGVIKANLPSRISFKVASKVDSRTILDAGGADHLIGKGDMLFLPPGSADLVRSQGAFVGDDEIAGIVDYISSKNGEPQFDEQFQRSVEEGEDAASGEGEDGQWDDDLVPDAIEVIRTSKRASTSMLQRRLKIGYNRAARIMELLEDEGIVGPENGSSPREILRDLDTF